MTTKQIETIRSLSLDVLMAFATRVLDINKGRVLGGMTKSESGSAIEVATNEFLGRVGEIQWGLSIGSTISHEKDQSRFS